VTFLSPLLLFGLAALAVPILLHLLRRRETRSLDFPALRYLTRTTREQARVIRLRQLLLLALRVTALALLVLAAARMVLPIGGRDHPPAGLALVIDNGIASGAITGDARVLDVHLARAAEALQRAGERDLVWIVAAGEPWAPVLPATPTEAREALLRLTPTHVTPDLPGALERAAALLEAGAPELREIILISELRENTITEVGAGHPPRSIPVRIVEFRGESPPNRGIGHVLVSGGLAPRAGDPGELLVQLEGEEVGGSTIRAWIDDELVSAVRAGADGMAILPFPSVDPGWVRGRVEIDPDDLRADDVAHFAFRAIAPPAVETVGQIPAYLEDALDVLEDAGRIRRGSGADVDVRFTGAGSPPLPSPREALVLIPPGDPAGIASLNLLLEEVAPGWRYEAVAPSPGEGRAFAGGASLDLLPPLPEVRQAHRVTSIGTEADPTGTVLLSLSDGLPWLLRIDSGSLPVLALASPLTLAATDLPASAAMIPLVDLLTTAGSAGTSVTSWRAGTPLPVPAGTASIRTPDGTRSPHSGTSLLPRTGVSGIYEFLDADGGTLALAGVTAVTPGGTARLTADAAVARIASGWDRAVPADRWPDSVLEGRRGREVWRPLIALLLLVLVAEGWLAAWGGGTRAATGSGSVPRPGHRSTPGQGSTEEAGQRT